MQELLGRIAALDPDASLGIRVIACFDELILGDVNTRGLLATAASLAGCPAGAKPAPEDPSYGSALPATCSQAPAPTTSRSASFRGASTSGWSAAGRHTPTTRSFSSD